MPRAARILVVLDEEHHDTAGVEGEALVVGVGGATSRRRPGDALREEASCPGRGGTGEQVARPFGADPVVVRRVVGDPVEVVGEIGELVHDEVRGERDDGLDERGGVERVADDGHCPEGCDRGATAPLPGRATA